MSVRIFYVTSLFALFFIGCGSASEPTSVPVVHNDPLEKEQWYLDNLKVRDVNVTGKGVVIALVDDGVDINHPDLKNNILDGNYNYLSSEHNFSDALHGTACAGIMIGVQKNDIGIRGIAPDAKLLAYNVLKAPSIKNLANALIRDIDKVWVSNNSWGDFNSWGEPFALREAIEKSLIKGTSEGRDGKGIIYVFAAGNGATKRPTDNTNYSGLVNNRFTIPVGAVDKDGKKLYYSEEGATLMVCAPSKHHTGAKILTTDVQGAKGLNPSDDENSTEIENQNYTYNFSGTSAATPMVSGIVALMLEANPTLTYRDVRMILAKSTDISDIEDSGWIKNGGGLWVNHKYGYGLLQADKAVALSRTWKNVGSEVILVHEKNVNKAIPDNNIEGVSDTIFIKEDISVEFVDIFFDADDHVSLGELRVELISPFGTKSILAEKHNEVFKGAFKYKDWKFGSSFYIGEKSDGYWKLVVKDLSKGHTGTFKNWKLKIYGHRNN